MKFDGFVPHFSSLAGGIAVGCLLIALVASSMIAAHWLGGELYHAPSSYSEVLRHG